MVFQLIGLDSWDPLKWKDCYFLGHPEDPKVMDDENTVAESCRKNKSNDGTVPQMSHRSCKNSLPNSTLKKQ